MIKDLRDNSQAFLQGHNADVSCVAVSGDGRYVASGETTHTGFKVRSASPAPRRRAAPRARSRQAALSPIAAQSRLRARPP